jgi:hypothetical protein
MNSVSTAFIPVAIILVLALAPPAAAAKSCGDTSNSKGRDVKCACGDTVTTNTVVKNDPVRRGVCAGIGLLVNTGVTVNLNGNAVTGNGTGVGLRILGNATVRNGSVRGFGTGILVEDGTVALTDVKADANEGSGLLVSPSSTGVPIVTVSGPLASVSDNGGSGIFIAPGAEVEITGASAGAKLPVLRNGGSGIEVRGQLQATFVKVGESADHGVLVETDDTAEFIESQVNDSGNHPDGGVANRAGVLVLRSPAGFAWTGNNAAVVRDNSGHGFVLGHAADQSGHVVADIRGSQIFANDIGIYAEQKDATSARTTTTILTNNIHSNRGSGVYLKSSSQGFVGVDLEQGFSGNLVHRNSVLPSEQNVCTTLGGAVQSASQIVFDGPVAGSDPTVPEPPGVPPDDPSRGPDLEEYPDDYVCYWSHIPLGRNITTEVECNLMNDPSDINPLSGGIVNHCVWDSGPGQCRFGWDIGGSEFTINAMCDATRNSVWNYVNRAGAPMLTQRGVIAVNGAKVRARRNTWGAGGAADGVALDSGFGSWIQAGHQCETTLTVCEGYDQIPRE